LLALIVAKKREKETHDLLNEWSRGKERQCGKSKQVSTEALSIHG